MEEMIMMERRWVSLLSELSLELQMCFCFLYPISL